MSEHVKAAKNIIEVWLRVYSLKWDGPPTWDDLGNLADAFGTLLQSESERIATLERELEEAKAAYRRLQRPTDPILQIGPMGNYIKKLEQDRDADRAAIREALDVNSGVRNAYWRRKHAAAIARANA